MSATLPDPDFTFNIADYLDGGALATDFGLDLTAIPPAPSTAPSMTDSLSIDNYLFTSLPPVPEQSTTPEEHYSDYDEEEEDATSKKRNAKSASTRSSKKAKTSAAEWEDKPPPEIYNKLSSKEKRQIRNKMSARNFRARKKEQEKTLEDAVAQRDNTISLLREQITSLQRDNTDLRKDVNWLKQTLEGVNSKLAAPSASNVIQKTCAPAVNFFSPEDELYADISLPALSPASSGSSSNVNDDSTTNNAFNIYPRPSISNSSASPPNRNAAPTANPLQPSADSMWSNTNPFISTWSAFVPETRGLPKHLNPRLAALEKQNSMPDLSKFTHHLKGVAGFEKGDGMSNNPYSMSADQNADLRRALYGVMYNKDTENVGSDVKAPSIPGLMPSFHQQPSQTSQISQVADLAQDTVSQKLSTAFFSAFFGPSAALPGATPPGQRLADVLTGKARLEVVSNDEKVVKVEKKACGIQALVGKFSNFGVCDRKWKKEVAAC